MFNEWKQKHLSTNSPNAKLQKIKEQIEKANNQLQMIQHNINTVNLD